MPTPVRVVISGTAGANVAQIVRDVARELGVPLADFTEMSEEEISRELTRRNGDHESTLFIVSPESPLVATATHSLFVCGSDASPDISLEPFKERFFPSGGKQEAVFYLRDTIRRKFPHLHRR